MILVPVPVPILVPVLVPVPVPVPAPALVVSTPKPSSSSPFATRARGDVAFEPIPLFPNNNKSHDATLATRLNLAVSDSSSDAIANASRSTGARARSPKNFRGGPTRRSNLVDSAEARRVCPLTAQPRSPTPRPRE